MGDDRPSVYQENGIWVIRASALGGCMRSLIAAGRDVEPTMTPEWMQKKFDEGHAGEDEIREWYLDETMRASLTEASVRQSDLKLVDGQWEFDLYVGHNILVRGHFDGITMGRESTLLGLEIKLLAPSTYAKATGTAHLDVIPTYPWQMAAYMAALPGTAFDWLCVEKNEDGTPNLERTHITRLNPDVPPKSYDEIRNRALQIIDWIENKDYDDYPACDVSQYPCPYFLLHDEEEVKVLAGSRNTRMQIALAERSQGELMVEHGKSIKDLADLEIKDILAEESDKSVMSEGTRVTWVHTETPEKYITPKPYTKKASVRDYPKITPPKDNDD